MIGPNVSSVAIEVKGPGSHSERLGDAFLSCLASYCTMNSNTKGSPTPNPSLPPSALFFFCYTKKEEEEEEAGTTSGATEEAVAVIPEQSMAKRSVN